MNVLKLPLLMSLFLLPVFSSGSALEYIRAVFPKISSAEALDEAISKIENESDPVVSAYRGALIMRKAEYCFSPFKKLAFFNTGKTIIEKAVNENPQKLEIKYVRLLVQSQSPGFLGYKKNIKEDLKFVFSNILVNEIDSDYKRHMINTILELDLLQNEKMDAIKLKLALKQL